LVLLPYRIYGQTVELFSYKLQQRHMDMQILKLRSWSCRKLLPLS
jgi:hypothetical protein